MLASIPLKNHLQTKSNLPFKLIAAITFGLASICIVVALPSVLSWRDKQVATLITKSQAASSPAVREEYLREAMILGRGGDAAPRALVDYYLSLGRYDKAWRVLNTWPLKPNYTRLGDYALRAQDYAAAQRFYARAIDQKGTAEAYVGLAAALFNKQDNANGCANAAKANKLDLANPAAQQMAVICILLNPKQTTLQTANYPQGQSPQLQTDRGVGQFLLANRIYAAGEKRLSASTPKSADDWLALALLANARGDYNLSVERGERGIALDRSNTGLNTLLAQTYRTLARDKAELYEARLKALPGVKAN